VTFNKDVKKETVTAGSTDPAKFSFLVKDQDVFVPGTITPESSAVMRFEIAKERGKFGQGDYWVVLFGDEDPANKRPAITDLEGRRLDGEPIGLPSGDGTEGGNFKFKFAITY
jgi:hypothetical protein